MSEAKKTGWGELVHGLRGKISATALFTLMNGVIIGVVTLVLLYFTMGNLRTIEARKATQGILQATEQAIEDMEKTVKSIAYFYATLDPAEQENTGARQAIQQMLARDIELDNLLWVTADQTQYWDGNSGNKTLAALPQGLPAFNELYKISFDDDFGQVSYIFDLPWPVLDKRKDSGGKKQMAMLVKARKADNTPGILLVTLSPDKVFEKGWFAQRDVISRAAVLRREDGLVITESLFGYHESQQGFFPPENILYVAQTGKNIWTIKFDIRPTLSSRILILAPWASFGFILSLTLLLAAMVQRRHGQDVKIAEMSRHLEGAHSELQSKTSERDKLFHTLRRSERENRAVINAVSDIIFETDENGYIVFLNEAWKRITDQETSAALDKVLFDSFDVRDRQRQKEMFDELVRGERQAYRSETRLDLGHGYLKPIEIAFSMLRMTEDKSLRVVGTITDIEKRKRAESALREAEQSFRSIFENSVSGLYQISPDGRFISANSAMADILGYASPDDLISAVRDVGEQVYVRPEDRKAIVQRLLFEGRVSDVETEVYCKDGRKIWLLENARVVRNENGGVKYYEGSAWDVTSRKEAAEAMEQARLQAEISSRSKMEFLANMSHELRTPLNAVIGFSEIIKDEVMGPLGTAAYKEYAQDIYDSGNYLLKVISEILEVSRIGTGNRELNLGTVRLAKALKSCMIIMSGRIEQSGVAVSVDLPEGLPDMVAEELGFKQIMLNLIGNAIKFTPKGGKVRVTAALGDKGEMIVDVIDNGIGMTEEEVKKAMQPFSKVETSFSEMKAGTGLGLTIVESLVQLHGGEFRLISEKGVGTTARVILPSSRVLQNGSSVAKTG